METSFCSNLLLQLIFISVYHRQSKIIIAGGGSLESAYSIRILGKLRGIALGVSDALKEEEIRTPPSHSPSPYSRFFFFLLSILIKGFMWKKLAWMVKIRLSRTLVYPMHYRLKKR